jgi:hypothetical protein
MSDAPKAVFLSYAREDTDAAKRIAEALRGFGVEVWFDQAELHGGDAWDAKIRKQIRECALFVPLVSQQTEARAEGYFRREWKIAIDRTQDMGSGRPDLCLVPLTCAFCSLSSAFWAAGFRGASSRRFTNATNSGVGAPWDRRVHW